MRPKKFDFDPDNTDDNGIRTIASISGAGALTLNGALVSGGIATMDYARRLGVLSAGDDSGDTLTIVGTDNDDLALTEVLTMANAGTAETSGYFKTVTSMTASGASAGNVTIGTVDEFTSQTIPIDGASNSQCTIAVDLSTEAMNYKVQETFDRIHELPNSIQSVKWHDIDELASKITDEVESATLGATAIRFVVNSFTDTAEAQVRVSQPTRS